MSGSTLNVCFVGAGFIAEYHARAVRRVKGARLAGVCDASAARAQAFARKWSVPAAYSDLQQMLAEQKPQVVHVLTPPDQHCAAALAAIDAGAHVLLEKPMCVSEEECDRIIRQAGDRGVRVGVGHNFLFYEPYERLFRDVRSGVLGRVDHITITWNRELPQAVVGPFDAWMLRDPRNIMLEIGPHPAAHLLHLLGEPDHIDVRADNSRQLPSGQIFYRRWQVRARKDNVAAELEFSFVPGFAEQAIHVRGTLGSATADLERNTYVLRLHTPRQIDFDRYAMIRHEARALLRQARGNLLRWLLSKLIRTGQGNPYGGSIECVVRAFYASIDGTGDARIAPDFGRRVVAVCTRVASMAGVEARSVAPATWRSAGDIPAVNTLVLGASGFIGAELVRQLIAAGRPVRVLVRNPGRLPAELASPLVEVIRGDLESPEDVTRAMRGVANVFHLARAMVKTWQEYVEHDIEVTRRVGEACLANGVRRLVYTGTIDSYYAGRRAGTITEDTGCDRRIHRRNLYARAKAAAEDLLLAMRTERGLPVVIVRPGIVIGRGGHPFHWGVGMWHHGAVCRIWGSGNNKLPFVLVDDVARGLIAAMDTPGIEGESFNLVADPCLSANEYLDELERALGIRFLRICTSPLRFYLQDMVKWVAKVLLRHPERRLPSYRDWESRTQRATFDCTRAKERLNWRPVADRRELIRLGIELPARQFLM